VVSVLLLAACAVSGNPLSQPKVCIKAKSYSVLKLANISIAKNTKEIEEMKEKLRIKTRRRTFLKFYGVV